MPPSERAEGAARSNGTLAPAGQAKRRDVFTAFFAIGCQSFGGGTATGALIRRTAVEQKRWLSEEEYARTAALVQFSPGMNLLALTALLGRRLAGTAGVAAALLGLLLPSVAITIAFAALFRTLGKSDAVRSALQNGVVPATVGLGLYGTWKSGSALLKSARTQGGPADVTLSVALCVGSGAAMLWWLGGRAPVFAILGVSGAVGALWGYLRSRRKAPTAP